MVGRDLQAFLDLYRVLKACRTERPMPPSRWIAAELGAVLTRLRPAPTNDDENDDHRLALADGGFTLWGRFHLLAGRPLQMLKVLLESRHNAATSRTLRSKMGVDDKDIPVECPDQVVRDTATKLRKALRKAAGKGNDYDPVPNEGRGNGDLTYRLDHHLLAQSTNRPE
jgi:hypothetical protein